MYNTVFGVSNPRCPLGADVLIPTYQWDLSNGGGGIRTPGAFPHSGFQDRRLKPLGHSSGRLKSLFNLQLNCGYCKQIKADITPAHIKSGSM